MSFVGCCMSMVNGGALVVSCEEISLALYVQCFCCACVAGLDNTDNMCNTEVYIGVITNVLTESSK